MLAETLERREHLKINVAGLRLSYLLRLHEIVTVEQGLQTGLTSGNT